jgi:hypothetical protein
VKVFLVKQLRSLHPADDGAEELLQRIKMGEIVEVELRRPRNIQHHRLFFALMNLVWQNIDHEKYPTVEALIVRMKIDTGHRDEMVFEGGVLAYIPRSISFAAMSQDEFSQFFDRCCDWIAEKVIPGITKAEILAEIEPMISSMHMEAVV